MRLLLETIKCWLGPVETRNIALLSAITKRDSRQKCKEMAWRVTGAFVSELTAQGVHAHIIELGHFFDLHWTLALIVCLFSNYCV